MTPDLQRVALPEPSFDPDLAAAELAADLRIARLDAEIERQCLNGRWQALDSHDLLDREWDQ